MDEIINEGKTTRRWIRMGNREIKICSFWDYLVLISDDKPTRCKLTVKNKSIEQAMNFKCTEVNITGNRNLR